MTAPLLSIRSLTVRFGGIVALDGVAVDVAPGSIQAVIGPNGAGKSTLINVVSGLCGANQGTITFAGARIDGRAPHAISRLGIARTFQNTELFGAMSALGNVVVALDRRLGSGPLGSMLHGPGYRRAERALRAEAERLLASVGLAGNTDMPAATLPFGMQRRLEIARALATRPRLLLLDEPAAGLRSAEVEDLNRILVELRTQQGVTILVIDHVMALVMTISDHITVLNFGRKIAEGPPQAVRSSPDVIKAYLGEKAAHALGA
jgi:branched-chain amino acid transport system ATP-binding protein